MSASILRPMDRWTHECIDTPAPGLMNASILTALGVLGLMNASILQPMDS